VSVGKSRPVPLAEAPQDHAAAIAHLARHGDYVAINVSSPNTPGLRALAAPEPLRAVLRAARAALVAAGAPACPLWLKLSPDLEPGELEGLVGLALDEGVAALILVNSTVRKDDVPAAAAEEGGLSGAPLRARALALLRQAHALCRGRLPLVGVGGIFTPADALARIRAGASLVQVYTGYVFEGPGLPRRINRHLDAVLRRERARLADLVGSEGAA
jgi:dihydroorotate dehydrogenase